MNTNTINKNNNGASFSSPFSLHFKSTALHFKSTALSNGITLSPPTKQDSVFIFCRGGFGMDNRGVNPILSLKDIAPAAANNINARFILLDKGKITTTGTKEGQNKTCLSLVADETASVHFQLWGYECDAFEPGDIIQLTNGIFSYSRNNLILRAGKRGKIVKVGEFTMSYVETPNISEIRWVPDPSDGKKYVKDVVLSPYSRMFPPLQ